MVFCVHLSASHRTFSVIEITSLRGCNILGSSKISVTEVGGVMIVFVGAVSILPFKFLVDEGTVPCILCLLINMLTLL